MPQRRPALHCVLSSDLGFRSDLKSQKDTLYAMPSCSNHARVHEVKATKLMHCSQVSSMAVSHITPACLLWDSTTYEQQDHAAASTGLVVLTICYA